MQSAQADLYICYLDMPKFIFTKSHSNLQHSSVRCTGTLPVFSKAGNFCDFYPRLNPCHRGVV